MEWIGCGRLTNDRPHLRVRCRMTRAGFCTARYFGTQLNRSREDNVKTTKIPLLSTIIVLTVAAAPIAAEKLTSHGDGVRILSNHGIGVSATGNCSDRNIGNCTSLEGIHDFLLFEVISLKGVSGCSITVTGGTECGHYGGYCNKAKDPNSYSHWNGYKIDVRREKTQCIQDFLIQYGTAMTSTPKCGWRKWSLGGAIYTLELPSDACPDVDPHWDILRTTAIGFGDNSSQYANDGECDDPRFVGPGMYQGDNYNEDIRHDATDCRKQYTAGRITHIIDR